MRSPKKIARGIAALLIGCWLAAATALATFAQTLDPERFGKLVQWIEQKGHPGIIDKFLARATGLGEWDISVMSKAYKSRKTGLDVRLLVWADPARGAMVARYESNRAVYWVLNKDGAIRLCLLSGSNGEKRVDSATYASTFKDTLEVFKNKYGEDTGDDAPIFK
jgi:hypothetical protein